MPIAVPERGSGPRKTGCPSPKKDGARRSYPLVRRFSLPDFPPETLCCPSRRHAFRAVPFLPSTSLLPGCGFPSRCFPRHRIPPRGIRFPGHPFPDTIFSPPCLSGALPVLAQVARQGELGDAQRRAAVGDQRDLFGGIGGLVGAVRLGAGALLVEHPFVEPAPARLISTGAFSSVHG